MNLSYQICIQNKKQIKQNQLFCNKIKQTNIKTKKMINSLQSAQHVIDLIVKQSKDIIQEHKIVKTMSIPYSSAIIKNKRDDTMLHAGVNYDKSTCQFFKRQIDSQKKPNNSIKDTSSFYSVKKYRKDKKQNNQISIHKQQSPKKAINNFFKSVNNKKRPYQSQNKKFQKTIKQQTKESSFIKLQQKKQQKVPKFLRQQDRRIDDLRQIKNQQIFSRQTQRKRQQSQSQISTQRQNKLTNYLQNHISRQNNHHTYDIQGGLLLFSSQANKKAISKAYPPTIRYDIQNQQDDQRWKKIKNRGKFKNRINSNLQFKRKFDPNIQSAKGQIFKSSVLKTINLSRISLGNQHFDQVQFMKRNDLFNNNHSRQTTSIPFMKLEGSSVFRQTATNQCLSTKDQQSEIQTKRGNQPSSRPQTDHRAKSHEARYRNQFKKYSSKRESQTCSNSFIQNFPINKIYPISSNNDKKVSSYGDTRYSSFYVQRPYTTDVGRIRRQNDDLFNSMLEQN